MSTDFYNFLYKNLYHFTFDIFFKTPPKSHALLYNTNYSTNLFHKKNSSYQLECVHLVVLRANTFLSTFFHKKIITKIMMILYILYFNGCLDGTPAFLGYLLGVALIFSIIIKFLFISVLGNTKS